MKQLSFLLLLLPGILVAQNFTTQPAKPKAGEMVRVEIDLTKSKLRGISDLEMVVMEYAGGKVEMVNPAVQMEGEKITGVFPLKSDAKSAVVGVRASDDRWDNNGGEGYFVTLFNADGVVDPEGRVAASIL